MRRNVTDQGQGRGDRNVLGGLRWRQASTVAQPPKWRSVTWTIHHAEQIEPDAAPLIETLVSHAEDPLADNSMIPLFRLAQFVRSRVTVALLGDGADELLAGYDTYRVSELAPYWQAVPQAIRRHLIAPLVWSLPVSDAKYGAANVLRRFAAGAEEPGPSLPLQLAAIRLRWNSCANSIPIRCSRPSPAKTRSGATPRRLADSPDDLSPLGQQFTSTCGFICLTTCS